jgi:hypothetical protein
MAFDWKTALEVGLGELGPMLHDQLQRKRASRVPAIEAIRKSAAASRLAGESREEANQRLADVLSMWGDQPKELLTQEFESIYNPNIRSEGYQFWADPTGQWGYNEETGRPEYSIFDAGTGGTKTYDFESFPSQLVPWDHIYNDPRSDRFLRDLDRQAMAGSPTGGLTVGQRRRLVNQGMSPEQINAYEQELQEAKGTPRPGTPTPFADKVESGMADPGGWMAGGYAQIPPKPSPDSPLFKSPDTPPPSAADAQREYDDRMKTSADTSAGAYFGGPAKSAFDKQYEKLYPEGGLAAVDPEDAVTAATGAPSPLEPNPNYPSQHRGSTLSGDVPWEGPAPFRPREFEQRVPTNPRFAAGIEESMGDAFPPGPLTPARDGTAPVEDFGPGPRSVQRRQTQERIPTPLDVSEGIRTSARNQQQRGPLAILNQARDPGIGEQLVNALETPVENILNAPGEFVDWVQGLVGERPAPEPSVSRRQTGYDWTAEDTSSAGLDSEMVPLMQAIQTQESSNQHYETRGDAESGVLLGDLDKFPTGSAGLMQVSQGAVDDVQAAGYRGPGREDPAGNQQLGARYLGLQLANPLILKQGGWRAALASYNQGPTSVMKDGISAAGRAYVEKVLSHMGPEARRKFIKWADATYGGTGVTRRRRQA